MKHLYIFIIALFCSCGRHTTTKYLYTGAQVKMYDTLGIVGPMDTVGHGAHMVRALLQATEFTYGYLHDFSLVNKAYASYKDMHTIKPLEKITDVRIIPIYNYNEQFPAGKNIADSCFFHPDAEQYDSLTYIYTRLNQNPLRKGEILRILNESLRGDVFLVPSPPGGFRSFSFRIAPPPARESIQQLIIEFETEAPSVFRDTTQLFIQQP